MQGVSHTRYVIRKEADLPADADVPDAAAVPAAVRKSERVCPLCRECQRKCLNLCYKSRPLRIQ